MTDVFFFRFYKDVDYLFFYSRDVLTIYGVLVDYQTIHYLE